MEINLIKIILFVFIYSSDETLKATALNSICGQYCNCGPPARPPESAVFLTNKKLLYNNSQIFYENESIVKYKCLDQNNLLIGSDTRTCQSGKWTGSVPKCGINLKNNIRLSSIEIFRNDSQISILELSRTQDFYTSGLYSVPYYLKPRECIDWTVKSADELWFLRFNQFVDINYIQIVLYSKQNLQNILLPNRGSALKPIINSGSSSSEPMCHLIKQSYKRNYLTLDYSCGTQHSLNQRLESLVLEYKSQEPFKSFSISLCELRVYQMPGDCGTPDHSISTSATAQLQDVYTFNCVDKNYMIKGNSYIKCNRSTGKWSGETPVCMARPYCKLIDNVFNKHVTITYEEINILDNGENAVFEGKLAYFQCNYTNENEFQNKPNSVTQVICRKGQWFGLTSLPSCEQSSSFNSKDDFKQLTDKLTIILMGIIIGILIIPTILLMKRSMRKKSPDLRENVYDDTNNYEQEHFYAEVDYWNVNEKMKSEEKFDVLKSDSNSNRNKNIYVESRL